MQTMAKQYHIQGIFSVEMADYCRFRLAIPNEVYISDCTFSRILSELMSLFSALG